MWWNVSLIYFYSKCGEFWIVIDGIDQMSSKRENFLRERGRGREGWILFILFCCKHILDTTSLKCKLHFNICPLSACRRSSWTRFSELSITLHFRLRESHQWYNLARWKMGYTQKQLRWARRPGSLALSFGLSAEYRCFYWAWSDKID